MPQKVQINKASLISPIADNLMIGGASIITFAFFWLFVDKSANVATIAVTAFSLSFIINFPHFFSSYLFIYGDYKELLFKKKSFFWAGIAAPLLIISYLVFSVMTKNLQLLGLGVQLMFLSVGWHYVKQIFGTAIVTSAVQKCFFSHWERAIVLLNLYAVWAMSFISTNLQRNRSESYGINYFTLNLPAYFLSGIYFLVGATLVGVLYMGVRKFIKTGARPANSSIISFLTIYVWYLPVLAHPLYFYLIPFFHSLQYMLFVTVLKKNQVIDENKRLSNEADKRSAFVVRYWGFLVLAAIIGAASFEWIPAMLDKLFPLDANVFGPTLWVFAFNIFINVHHYFIDNVIWRGDNDFLKNYLVKASQMKALHVQYE